MFFLEFVLCGGLMNSQDPVNNFGTVSPFWPPWSRGQRTTNPSWNWPLLY
jgi:hypothetical protein